MALTDNLISYWKLDEASGNALDAHGTNDLTETSGTIGSAAGKIGNARDCEAGDTEHFERANNAELQTGDIDFTATGWVNFRSFDGAFQAIIGKGYIEGSVFEWLLYYDTGAARFVLGVSKDGVTFDGTLVGNTFGAASLGVWYFCEGIHDAANNQLRLAINGVADTLAYSLGVFGGAGAFRIGAGSASLIPFDGLIDEVGFWKRVLTADERTALYNGGAGLPYESFNPGLSPALANVDAGFGFGFGM